MELTRSVFNRNAQLLIRALEVDTNQKKIDEISVESDVTAFELCRWSLERDNLKNPNSIYLVHPPVKMVTPSNDRSKDSVQNSEQDFHEESLLEDTTVSVDEHVLISKDHAEDSMDVTTIWTFSVVYSSTYRAPILYFHVQSPHGDPCGRQDVLDMLRNVVATDEIPTETWEFISQEEHPFSGYPSFFFHPCQSSHRLQLMTISSTDIASGEDADESPDKSATQTNLIWAWMSMIFPFIGHAIPVSYYMKIRRCMDEM